MLKNVLLRFKISTVKINNNSLIINKTFINNNNNILYLSKFNFCKKLEENKGNKYSELNFFDELEKLGIKTLPDKTKSKFAEASKYQMKNITKEERENRAELLKREFINNPEFLKAFPHLEDVIRLKLKIPDDMHIEEYIKKNIIVSDKDKPYYEKSTNYFESLLNKYTNYDLKTQEEKQIENNNFFLDGVKDPVGPLKTMSRAEKEKIHDEIDLRLQELEDSGLSKEEILFNKPEGIALKYDKFFQYIKENRIARELLIKPSEKFTAEVVIEKALKQNIGPDANMGLDKKRLELSDNLPRTQIIEDHKRMFDPKKKVHLLQEDDYDYRENYIKKLKLFENFHKERPTTFVNPPLLRSQLRSRYMIKTIRKKDVTWKNLPFLVKFLNEAGKLMNKYQSRLPTNVHRRVAKSVKHARHMGLLPYVDYIRGFDKIPLTSTYNDFIDDVSTVIDKKTGMIKHIHQPSLQDKFTYSNFQNSTEALKAQNERVLAEKFKNSLKIDKNELPFVPDYDQRELIRAQNFNIKNKYNLIDENNLDKFDENEKKAYEVVSSKIKESFSGSNLIDFYFNEKSYNYTNIKDTQKYFVDVEKDEQLNQAKNHKKSTLLHELKEKTKKNLDNIINESNLNPQEHYTKKSQSEKTFIPIKTNLNNIEPKATTIDLKQRKYSNFKRFKTTN